MEDSNKMAAFLTDTFTGTDGTGLTSHTGETGATWTEHTDFTASADLVIASNRIRSDAAGAAGSFIHASGSPSRADYYVEGILRAVSLPGTGYAGIGGRCNTSSGGEFYWVVYNLGTTQWELYRFDTIIGTYSQSLSGGTNYTVRLDMSGSRIRVLIDSVVRIDVSNTSITAAGKAMVIGYGAFSDSTGLHLDSISGDLNWTRICVCDGDSITSGLGLTATEAYPWVLGTNLGLDWKIVNVGVSGQELDDMESDAAASIDTLFDAGNAANVVVCFGGTNDFYFNASTATVQTRFQTYCESRQSAGWRVVACTMLPRGDFAGTSTLPGDAAAQEAEFESRRATFNTWLSANWRTFADALADLAADTNLGDDGDEDSGTYYQDTVHPTAAGMAIIAGIVESAVLPITTGTSLRGGLHTLSGGLA